MSTLANPPAGELVPSEAHADVTDRVSSIDMFIGTRVRIRRTSRGVTQQDLSQLLDIDRDNLAAHEAGVDRINAKLLFQIAELLDVRPHYFFRGYTREDWKAARDSELNVNVEEHNRDAGTIVVLRDLDSGEPMAL
jgi:transcriptional regulator with XRE-family HTH domain